jgi:hypothetical protein
MTLTLAPTGSAIGDYEQLTSLNANPNAQRTQVGEVTDPGLREALDGFAAALHEPLAALRGFLRTVTPVEQTVASVREAVVGTAVIWHVAVGVQDDIPSRAVRLLTAYHGWGETPVLEPLGHEPQLVGGSDDAATIIAELADRVGLPVKDILAAAGVKKSTFHSWRMPDGPRPRVASQGRLWELAQCVEDLEELLGGSARPWILADPARRERFRSGRFLDLVENFRSQPRPRLTAPSYAELAAAGGDRLAIDSEPEPPRRPRGRPGVAHGARAADRHRS